MSTHIADCNFESLQAILADPTKIEYFRIGEEYNNLRNGKPGLLQEILTALQKCQNLTIVIDDYVKISMLDFQRICSFIYEFNNVTKFRANVGLLNTPTSFISTGIPLMLQRNTSLKTFFLNGEIGNYVYNDTVAAENYKALADGFRVHPSLE